MKFLTIFAALVATVNAFSVNRVFVGTPSKVNPRLVKDCMTSNPMTLKTTDTIDDAIETLLEHGYNGAPVVHPISGKLVGVLSAFDFLLKENGGAVLDMHGTKEEMMETAAAARKICATTVGDLMTPIICSISPDTTMKEAAAMMTMDRVHRMCVVNEDDGTLVGILAVSDVMRDVLTTVHAALPPESESSTDLSP